MNFVLDASVTLLWLAPGTQSEGIAYAETVLNAMDESKACVPTLWALEIANVIAKLENKGIVTEADAQRFIGLLQRLDVVTDPATTTHALSDTLNLARRHKLSAYDAAYLELSLRAGVPLATLDAGLAKAATNAGIPIFGR